MRKIKLFLSMLMLIAFSVGNVWADKVDITSLGTQTWSNYSLTSGVVTVSTNLGTGQTPTTSNAQYRWKAGNIITIEVSSGNVISSIQFKTNSSAAYGPKCLSYNSTAITNDGTDYTWDAPSSISSASFSVTSEARLTEIHVTYAASSGGGGQGGGSGTEGDGIINFGSAQGSTNVNSASVSGDDDLDNTWTVTTVGTTSFTPNAAYAQIGSSSKPATSITFTTTLSQEMKVTAFSAKFGGFSNTAGTVTLKVGDTTVGTGSLNGTSDVTVEADDEATGTVLTVTVTGIAKGVKAYFISYTLEEPSTPDPGKQDLPVDDFKWSAASYTATIGASNTFPTLTNNQSVEFSYESSSDAIAEIASNGDITLKKAGTTSIKAVFDGNDTYNAKTVSYTLTVKDAPLTTMDAIFDKATDVGGTATDVDITFNNWVVSGAKGKTAYVTDGTKGLIIYYDNHGFAEGDILSGTGSFKLKLYNGAAEITAKNSGTITITKGGSATLNELDAEAIAALSGINTGSLIKISGAATSNNNKYYVADVQLYNTLFDYTAPTVGKNYNCTGVFVKYTTNNTDVKEIMPRKTTDLELQTEKTLSSISLSGTYPTEFEQDDAFSHAGMTVTANYSDDSHEDVTASATFTGYDMSATGEQTVTVHYSENATEVTETYTITVNTPASTGEWELFEGELSDLTAGNYLIYDNGSAMLAQISSNRFAYETETPDANGIISNPSGYAVWTLAKSGDYWTFYNAKAGKYAAGNGTKNQGALNADGTVDASLWSISNENGIVNKGNAASSVNATLRHNEDVNNNYGFACYGSTTGNQPVFYKPATPSYSITATLTGCTADANNPTKVPQALEDDIDLKYNLTAGYVWPDAITVTVGGVALDPNELDYLWDNTVSPAELTIAKEKVNGNIVITITAIEKELDNITIDQAPNKVAYETGEFFNPAGLQISLNYTGGIPSDIVEYNDDTKANFTFSPDLETALALENDKVTITYAGKTVDQDITVTDPVPSSSVVAIIAKMGDDYYAMSTTYNNNAFTAIAVTKDGDDFSVPTDEVKASILWTMNTLGAKAKFQGTDDNYLAKGNGNTDLVYSEDEVEWTWSADGYYYYSSGRTFISNGSVFKNYATSNISASGYSDAPEFIAEANIKVVPVEAHEFVVTPDAPVAFGTVEVDETVSPKSFDVTLTGITSATVTLSDDAAFSIDKSALDADGTITVTPNTATAGNFSATITLSDDDNLAEDKVINVTMKVVAPKDCDREDDFSTVGANSSYTTRNSTDGWNAVNTAVITGEDITYWMISGGTDEVGVITSPEFNYGIGKLSFDYKYTFSESNGVSFKVEIKQNGALVAGKSYTITNASAEQNTVYSETIENINVEGKFQIVITNLSPSNKTGHKDRFAIGNLCWKKYGEPVYDEVRSGLEVNRYYTVCLPKKVTAIKGASFWTLNNKSQDGATAYLEEETNNLPFAAGKPFIIQATADKLEVVYEGAATEDAGTNGALHGTLVYMNAAALTAAGGNDVYMLYENALRPVGENNHLDANRAYVLLSALNAVAEAPQSAPGKRVRAMPMQPQVATGIDALNASDAPAKVLINGQLFIIRGEKMFDAKGQLVK